jgi:hypothetical protein
MFRGLRFTEDVGVSADMPFDNDFQSDGFLDPPDYEHPIQSSGERAAAATDVKPAHDDFSGGSTDPAGRGSIDAECKADRHDPHNPCEVFLRLWVATHQGHIAAASKPVAIALARGRVPVGKRRTLAYKLTRRGLRLLRSAHTLPVTVIGTSTQGGRQTLVEGHLTLRLKR